MTDESLRLLREQLERHEGLRLMPYTDTTGHLTIGVGRNLSANGITFAEAMAMLDHDIAIAANDCISAFPWFNKINDVRQRVLIDMCFNLGRRKLLQFTNTLKAIEDGRYDLAAQGMLKSKWARQVKGRAVRLAEMMRQGRDIEGTL